MKRHQKTRPHPSTHPHPGDEHLASVEMPGDSPNPLPGGERSLQQMFYLLTEPSSPDLAIREQVKARLLNQYDQWVSTASDPAAPRTWVERLLFQYPWRVLLPVSCTASLMLGLLIDGLFVKMVNFITMLGG